VEKGMQHGQKIVFQGQADEAVSICYRHKRTCLHVFNIYLMFQILFASLTR
jgi:hypothetical protein